jgi:hypothetical protein
MSCGFAGAIIQNLPAKRNQAAIEVQVTRKNDKSLNLN